MNKWLCDGGCGTEFGGAEEAQYKSRVVIKDLPSFTGSHKIFLCEKCGKKLMAQVKKIFPSLRYKLAPNRPQNIKCKNMPPKVM